MSESQWFNYRDLSKRMGVKPETARRASDRAKLEKRKGNDGKQEVLIDLNDPRFDGTLGRSRTKSDKPQPVLNPERSQLVLSLRSELKEEQKARQKVETALQVSEAIRSEKEAQIDALKDHIETLKDRPRKRWFWTR